MVERGIPTSTLKPTQEMLSYFLQLSKEQEFDAAGQFPDGYMEFWYQITDAQRAKFPRALDLVYGLMIITDSNYGYDFHRLFASESTYKRAIDAFEANSGIKRLGLEQSA